MQYISSLTSFSLKHYVFKISHGPLQIYKNFHFSQLLHCIYAFTLANLMIMNVFLNVHFPYYWWNWAFFKCKLVIWIYISVKCSIVILHFINTFSDIQQSLHFWCEVIMYCALRDCWIQFTSCLKCFNPCLQIKIIYFLFSWNISLILVFILFMSHAIAQILLFHIYSILFPVTIINMPFNCSFNFLLLFFACYFLNIIF